MKDRHTLSAATMMAGPSQEKTNWFTMSSTHKTGKIYILDEIGCFGIGAQEFKDALDALGEIDTLEIFIMSPGGSVIDGNTIFNMLLNHPAHKIVNVDFAASMASIIAMAGDELSIAENGYFMIHNPSIFIGGGSDDLRRMADLLDHMRDTGIKAYQRHTEKSAEELQELMDAETWMTGAEAVEMGFFDSVSPKIQAAASFDFSSSKNVPAAALEAFGKKETGENENGNASEGDAPESKNTDTENTATDQDEPAATDPVDPVDPVSTIDESDFTARIEAVQTQLQTLSDAITTRDEQIAQLTESITTAEDAVAQLSGGFVFSPDSAPTAKTKHKFLQAVDARVDAGEDYQTALIKTQKENPGLYEQFIRDNEIKKES